MDPKSFLSSQNPHSRDKYITFNDSDHTYTVEINGRRTLAPTSATKFAERYFSSFNAKCVVDENYYKWKANERSSYHAFIRESLNAGATDNDAKLAIVEGWKRKASAACSMGTAVHAECELVCNGVVSDTNSIEIRQLIEWTDSWQKHKRWKPFRTEWRLYYDHEDQLVMAGTPDLVLESAETGEFALVDFKISPALLGPATDCFTRQAQPPIQCFEDSKYGRYATQLNILSHVLRTKYGIDVADNMYLLQLHRDMDTWHCVQVPQHRDEIDTLFRIETQRILS